jgi:hypothetical protein
MPGFFKIDSNIFVVSVPLDAESWTFLRRESVYFNCEFFRKKSRQLEALIEDIGFAIAEIKTRKQAS